MPSNFVLTVLGTDRIGIVDHVTDLVLKAKYNIGASRMAHLGGEFAMMLYVTSAHQKSISLKEALTPLEKEGFTLNIVETKQADPSNYAGWVPYRIKISGADHEGVVHEVSRYLAKHQVNIENMESSIVSAPMSGTPLFMINATVVAPPHVSLNELSHGLEKVGDELNMDTEVSSFNG